nr:MAG: RNA-dependent RNA polymerase [Pestalotiopsis partitivirus 1]
MTEESFIDMTYAGLKYYTSKAGDYVVKAANSLAYLGRHNFGTPQREEFATYTDPGIEEALHRFPDDIDLSKFDNFSRSYYSLAGHMDALHNYGSDYRVPEPVSDPDWQATKQHCFELFSTFPKVTALDFLSELKDVPFEPTSAAGIGMPGKKGDGDNHKRAVRQASATIYHCISDGIQSVIDNSTPDMAFVRTQLTDLTKQTKIRHVFGQAFQYILLEGLFAYPFLSMFMTIDSPYFLGRDPRTEVVKFIEQLTLTGKDMFSTDWSRFDQTAEHWEITFVFELLESILKIPNHHTQTAWDFVKIFFTNRKIAAPDGTLWLKARGVPSGSYFTNLVDTFINYARIQYMTRRLTGDFIDPKHIRLLGDDALFAISAAYGINPYRLVQAIPMNMRDIWQLRPDKMSFGRSSDMVEFLQRTLKFGDQHRDNDRVERLALFPEYPITDKRISAYRARALWEDGNYESNLLGYITAYLEHKYGTPDKKEIPRWVQTWVEKLKLPVTQDTEPVWNRMNDRTRRSL